MREDLNMGIKRTCHCYKCGKLLEETNSGCLLDALGLYQRVLTR